MIKKTLIVTLILFTTSGIFAQKKELTPHINRVEVSDKPIKLPPAATFKNIDSSDKDTYQQITAFFAPVKRAKFKVSVGLINDKGIKNRYKKKVPKKDGGYFLLVDKKRIVVAGYDLQGKKRGLQTLKEILSQDEICITQIIE